MALSNTERSRKRRARLREEGFSLVANIWAHPDDKKLITDFASKLLEARKKKLNKT